MLFQAKSCRYTHSKLRIIYCMAFFSGSLPKVQYHTLTARCIKLRVSAQRQHAFLCAMERVHSLLCAGEKEEALCGNASIRHRPILPTFLRHLARVPLCFSKALPHLLLCNGGLALFYSLHFNPTLSVSGRRNIFAPFWFYGGMAVNADPILALPGL